MIDVVLPVLDEAEALPWVLGRMPDGYRAIVADNGSTRRLGASRAARSARSVVDEPRRGFGAACWAGLQRRHRRRRVLHGLRRLARSARPPARRRPGRAPATADLVLGARARRAAAPGRCTRAWPTARSPVELRRRTGVALTDLGPMRAARREALLALGIADRRFGWPLEMVLRGDGRGLADRRGRRPLPPATGARRSRARVRGSARAVRDMRAVLAELA